MEQNCTIRLELTQIIEPAQCVRNLTDDKKTEGLARSMLEKGLLQPVIVRRAGDGYELVAGLRRFKAAKQLDYEHIDAIVLDCDESDAVLTSLVENIQREELHYLDVAAALKRLVDDYALTQDELCITLGMSQSCLCNRLRLNKLPQRVKQRLALTQLSERHARALLRLEGETAQLKAVEHCQTQALSVRQFEAYIDRVKAQDKASNRFKVYLRDHRMLINAVLNTVKSLNAAGVRATSHVTEHDDRIEVVVSLPLNAGKRLA